MGEASTYSVVLTDPVLLARVIDQYLVHGVCPVDGAPSPGPLKPVVLDVRLPAGKRASWQGRVIRATGRDSFLVELQSLVRLESLDPLARRDPPAPHAEPQAAQVRETIAGDDFAIIQGSDSGEHTAPEKPPDACAGMLAGNPQGMAETVTDALTGKESEYSDVYSRIKNASLQEKQKLARFGAKTVRQLLIRDPNKNLHVLLVQNPHVTLDEMLEYTKVPTLAADAIRLILQNRSFCTSRQLLFNLVRNPATPLDIAQRLVPQLGVQEWRALAKSTSVRAPISAAARKLLALPG
jgi:hypothetical protein